MPRLLDCPASSWSMLARRGEMICLPKAMENYLMVRRSLGFKVLDIPM
jgi:hypothetical protein